MVLPGSARGLRARAPVPGSLLAWERLSAGDRTRNPCWSAARAAPRGAAALRWLITTHPSFARWGRAP